MPTKEQRAVFAIDGYEVSASFAESGDTAAIGQVKQILLSSFASNASKSAPIGILAIRSEQRDNSSREKPCVP